jgi:hypothetical protein
VEHTITALDKMRVHQNLGTLCVISVMFMCCSSSQTDQKAIERRLAAAVPLQRTASQVLDFLTDEKIEHSDYLRDAIEGNSIRAIIRDQSRWRPVKTNYSIVFRFDSRDRLTGYDVRPVYTGP